MRIIISFALSFLKCMGSIFSMHEVDLRSVDLNLLKFLGALLDERSVTRAGARLGLSQPAASRALGRLRELLKDRVVVRTPKGLESTPRALALAPIVERLLEDVRNIVAPAVFDPATARHHFKIASIDHMALMMMPGLVARLEQAAPGVTLEIPTPRRNNVETIARGEADLALGVYADDILSAGFYRRKLYDEDMVCVVRRGHPILSVELTPERFAALSHVLVTITGQGSTLVDTALARLGLSRTIAVRLPHFLVAPMIVAASHLVLTLPRRLAERMAAGAPLEIIELPLDLDAISPSMIWHERTHDAPAHAWLRRQIMDIAQERG